ncbi:DUF4269 domain-containing protein [Gynurincola endophyticus]|uniref:DUF4269 domain-containing protein n=1 Tax=Gynurincola endophyticus TaxID=2479004 RepID=UPI000F8C9436|nr:DUF4269 domain-containing protein [Gynurincola endophyticus]
MMNFADINYLKKGNELQKQLYDVLVSYHIMDRLSDYQPVITGTIPIEINIATSDVDIILYATELKCLQDKLITHFSHFKNFEIYTDIINTATVVITTFTLNGFCFELFAQAVPTTDQYAYLHMIKEYEILQQQPETFKKEIIKLKESGIKTEPAFAQLLGLEGNPYEALLNYQIKY